MACTTRFFRNAATIGLALPSAIAAAPPAVDHDYDAYATPAITAKVAPGRTINLVCVGKGSPTVILTAGAGDWSGVWRKVQPAVGRTTRACAWDRAGYGFSSPSREVQDLAHTEPDLERALKAAGIKGPYVLVSHSIGSYETMRFADRRPGQVAGIVLVDPSFPDQFRLLSKAYPAFARVQLAFLDQGNRDLQACIAGERAGTMKPGAAGWPACMGDDPEYPETLRANLQQRMRDPVRLQTELSYMTSLIADGEQVINPKRAYGDTPLTILTAPETSDFLPASTPKAVIDEMKDMQAHGWVAGHDRLAALSSRGRNIIVPGTSHYIQLIKPQIVIDAVDQVVRDARGHTGQ